MNTARLFVSEMAEHISMPDVYVAIRNLLLNPDATIDDFVEVIESDSMLCVRVMRMARSGYFGFPRHCENLYQAISLIGLMQLHDLMLGSLCMRTFSAIPEEVLNLKSFWRYNVQCGIAARTIARFSHTGSHHTFFSLGLLHEIGHASMFLKAPEASMRALDASQSLCRSLAEAEREELGFDYGEVGAEMMQLWHLPPVYLQVAACHLEPRRAQEEFRDAVNVVHLAHEFCQDPRTGQNDDLIRRSITNSRQFSKLPENIGDILIEEIDTHTFTASDGSTQTVTVTINGSEDAAVIGGTATGTVDEDGTLTASDTLTITDVDTSDNPVSFTDVATTLGDNGYGDFELTSNAWTYTLNNSHAAVQALDVGETLNDSYTFTASDGSTQTVTVTINGSEDAAVIGGTATGTVDEDGTLIATDTLTITDTDTSDNPVSFNDVAATLGDNGYGDFELTGNTWIYTLNNGSALIQALDAGESLTDAFTFTASDGSTQTVTVTINGAEDAPTVDNAIADQSATEDIPFNFTVANDSFGDLDSSDTLTYTATLDDDSPLPTWLVFDGTTRTFSGTPTNADVGTIDIKVNADDGSSTISNTFILTTINASDAPVIGGVDTGTVTEDVSVLGGRITTSGSLTIADPDIGESSFQAATVNGSFGDLTIDSTGNWQYGADNGQAAIQSLDAGQTLTETLTVTAFDGNTHDITITLNGNEDAAVIGGTAVGTVAEDGTLAASETLTITDVDTSDNPVSFNDVSPTLGDNGYGIFELTANTWTYTLNSNTGTIQSLDEGESLSDTFTFDANDGSTRSVVITISGAEDAPTLNSAISDQTASQNVAFDLTIDANTFGDLDASDTLSYIAMLDDDSALPAWLDFDDTTRTFSGTPGSSDVGDIGIRISASDGNSAATETFTLTVSPVNSAPIIGGNDRAALTEDVDVVDGQISVAGALSITDPDAGESSFVPATVNGELGSLTIDTDGNWRYSATNSHAAIQALQDGESIAEALAVTTADGSSHNVVVLISGAPEAPPPTVEAPVTEPSDDDESSLAVDLPAAETPVEGQASLIFEPKPFEVPIEFASPPAENVFDDAVQIADRQIDSSGGDDTTPAQEVQQPRETEASPDKPMVEAPANLQVADSTSENNQTRRDDARRVFMPGQEPQMPLAQQQSLNHESVTFQVSDDEVINDQFEQQLLDRINLMHGDMDDAASQSADDVDVRIVMGSTASITVGIVSWVLRGGSLVASLMSTVPLLSRFDPLPILKTREDDEDEPLDDGDETGDHGQDHSKRVDNLFAGKHAQQANGSSLNE